MDIVAAGAGGSVFDKMEMETSGLDTLAKGDEW